MSLEDRLEVPDAKSRASTRPTDSPRVAASSAAPVPVEPPPTTSTSNVWVRRRCTARARCAGLSELGSLVSSSADCAFGLMSARLSRLTGESATQREVPMQSGTRRWSWQRSTLGELVAEFLGTLVIIAFGDGVVAMVVAALNQSGRGSK